MRNALSEEEKRLFRCDEFTTPEGVDVVRIRLFPKERLLPPVRLLNVWRMRRKIKKLDKRFQYDTVVLTYPLHFDYLPKEMLNRVKLVYDCMDDYKSILPFARHFIAREEEKLLGICHVLTCSSEALMKVLEQYPHLPARCKVINNGVNSTLFDIHSVTAHPIDLPWLIANGRKRACYVGTISHWLDVDALAEAADKLPQVDFYMVGPAAQGIDLNRLSGLQNVHFTGSRPAAEVPHILAQCHVALLPFKLCDTTLAVNPVKLYEYLSMGRPVVAVRYNETERFGPPVYTYGEGGFIECLRQVLDMPPLDTDEAADFCRKNDWHARVEEFIAFCR